MKKIILGIVCLLISLYGKANVKDSTRIEYEISFLQSKQKIIEQQVLELLRNDKDIAFHMEHFISITDELQTKTDSLQKVYNGLSKIQKKDKDTLAIQINKTKSDVQASLSARTQWVGAIAVFLSCTLLAIVWLFLKKFKSGSTSIDEVRKAQEALEKAQTKMQEESVKLDNRLLEIVDKQLSIVNTTTSPTEPDHDLAKKVADEIVRIEMNLARMDSSIKGYKQLSKAVQRIKDNFNANGYEIVDMLGQPYNEGMKVVANFVPDENLKEGEQVITGIIKPQINFHGVMIQSAQITVSQNI